MGVWCNMRRKLLFFRLIYKKNSKTNLKKQDVIEVKKDTDRIEEIKSLKRAWEAHEGGRAAKATIARADFLKAHQVRTEGAATDDEGDKPPEEEQPAPQAQPTPAQPTPQNVQIPTPKVVEPKSSKEPKSKQSVAGDEVKSSKGSKQKKDKAESVKASQELTPQVNEQLANESITIEEPLSNRPPTPPKPKFYLPPIDVAPFLRVNHFGPVIKDEAFEKEQTQMRKMEMDSFLSFKDQIHKFREEERKFRLHQKLKQIEDCEALQVG